MKLPPMQAAPMIAWKMRSTGSRAWSAPESAADATFVRAVCIAFTARRSRRGTRTFAVGGRSILAIGVAVCLAVVLVVCADDGRPPLYTGGRSGRQ